jgi:hypothetical protein
MLAADITDDPMLHHHGTIDVRPVAPDESLLERLATPSSSQ